LWTLHIDLPVIVTITVSTAYIYIPVIFAITFSPAYISLRYFQNNHDTIQIRVHDTPLDKINKTTTEKKGHGKPLTWMWNIKVIVEMSYRFWTYWIQRVLKRGVLHFYCLLRVFQSTTEKKGHGKPLTWMWNMNCSVQKYDLNVLFWHFYAWPSPFSISCAISQLKFLKHTFPAQNLNLHWLKVCLTCPTTI
jgi:hypothetical protein